MKKITEAQAERVRKSIITAFSAHAELSDGPIIRRDWDRDGDCVLIWEEGPYDWPHLYTELAAGYAATDLEFGFSYKPVKPVKGVFAEPWNGCVLGLYRD